VDSPDRPRPLTVKGELLDRARELAGRGGRALLGVVGAPGSGKSTLAAALADALGDRAVVVGMDGFHLPNVALRQLGRMDRKGAPDTFDALGYVDLVRRLRADGETVYAPGFSRDLDEPVPDAVVVPQHVRMVITEGNYLLLDGDPWCRIRQFLDDAWFLAPDDADRVRRLIARHRMFGETEEQAHRHACGSDQRNAELIAPTASRADLVVTGSPFA
jgi:pantothenate kinase